MNSNNIIKHGIINRGIEYWPAFVDILMTILMVLILQSFLQTTLNVDTLESARIKQAQETLEKAIQKEFPDEIKKQQIIMKAAPNLLLIRFSDRILFATGDYKLANVGKDIMARCAKVLNHEGNNLYKQLEVEGHTDDQNMDNPHYPHNNWELSTARSLAVVEHMILNQVKPEKLSANGYAQFSPIANNVDPEGRNRNRRIELRIIFSKPN